MLAGRFGRKHNPWKKSVAGKKIIQGVRGDLKTRIAATGHLYGLLTTQDLNCVLCPPKMLKIVSENFIHALLWLVGLFLKISPWVPLGIACGS